MIACLALLLAAGPRQHLGPPVPREVRRVVTLAPSLSEIVLALGAQDRLVGVTRFDDDPRAQKIPRVGGYNDPQPEAVEKELGKLLPERLLCLYEDKSAIQAAGFQLEEPGGKRWWPKRWQVYCFEPLDPESLNELPFEEELGPGFCFATTGRGSWYWIAASDQRAKDSPVIFLDYDGGRSHGETVANSLEEFLNLPRLPTK